MTSRSSQTLLRAVAAGALAGASCCWAGRPLVTEDADVLERGQCEWETYAARESGSAAPSSRGWATQAGCGFGHGTQAALAYGRFRAAGETTPAWTLVGKTAWIPREGDGTGITVAWSLGAERAPGESWKHESTTVGLVATRTFDARVTVHGNLGTARSEAARQFTTTWAAAAEWIALPGLDLMGEVYGDDRSRPWIGVGARYALSDRVSINASVAEQNDRPRARLWTVGFKLGF